MTAQDVVFLLLAVATGLSSVAVVTARNMVHAVLFLAVSLGGTAGVFLVLHADFVAFVQLLVYVGAIAVLLMFGLMLTRAPIGRETLDSQSRGLGLGVAAALFGVLGALIWQAYADAGRVPLDGPSAAEIGMAIFSRWVLPFEVLSLLLTAALVGAIVLSQRGAGESGPEDELTETSPHLAEPPHEATAAEPRRQVGAGTGGGA